MHSRNVNDESAVKAIAIRRNKAKWFAYASTTAFFALLILEALKLA